MKFNDVRLLWARSGNRCAFPQCRIEMAPAGSPVTLGEIAHIVAKSPDGPRGAFSLSNELRDDYDNLILLCPNHHTVVDSSPAEWPVEKLKLLKLEHERWVSSQLENGSITVSPLGGIQFISDRIAQFVSESQTRTWVYVALTPLSVEDEAIDPKAGSILGIIEKTHLPDAHCLNPQPNRYHTIANQHGIQNEDLRQLQQGQGHRIQVYRSGHVEMSICIDFISTHITSLYRNRPFAQSNARKLIHYSNVTECAESCVDFLWRLWDNVLPFPNMIASYALTDTQNTTLVYDSMRAATKLFSNAVNAQTLQANRVFERHDPSEDLLHFVLQRIVESYGWVLPNLRDDDGMLSLPRPLVG